LPYPLRSVGPMQEKGYGKPYPYMPTDFCRAMYKKSWGFRIHKRVYF